jgi:hypothetical protein
MSPKQDSQQTDPSSARVDGSALSMPFVARLERLPQHIEGATGRVWSTPFEMTWGAITQNESPRLHFSANNGPVIRNTLRFLIHNAPDAIEPFMAFMEQKEPRTYSWMSQYLKEETAAGPVANADAVRSPLGAPRSFTLPTLDEHHWAYGMHYELGHGVSVYDDFKKDCQREALSDLGSMRWYIEKYNELAKSYTGEALERATDGAQFRDPYYTCMQICFKDMEIPEHFMALVHYGIGTFMLTWGCHKDMTRPLYDRLVAMYTEDFV